ncbi:hypothetical protein AV274_5161 [Blastocystis sp. ATCC 50177/Nand II]|nr:hypothetical protein AV274_5161 [Blastocystis sp. ATCC 50177/Nand II]
MGDEVFMNCSKWMMEGVKALETVTFSMGNMKKLSSISIKDAPSLTTVKFKLANRKAALLNLTDVNEEGVKAINKWLGH